MLAAGGNAIDAAIASLFALTVVAIMTTADLTDYRTMPAEVVRGTTAASTPLRHHRQPPPSAGGVHVIKGLNIL